jgi:hypothetical protein
MNRVPAPPRSLHALAAAWGQRNALLAHHTTALVRWHDANFLLAPHVSGQNADRTSLVGTLFTALVVQRGSLSDDRATTEIELAWDPGDWLKKSAPPALGMSTQSYGQTTVEARRLFQQFIRTLRDAAAETAWHVPRIAIPVTASAIASKEFNEALRATAGDRMLRPHVTFEFHREGNGRSVDLPLWVIRDAIAQRVTINLPRAAMRAGSVDRIFDELDRIVDLAAAASEERAQMAARLLSLRDLGPWSALTFQQNGAPYCSEHDLTYLIAVSGMNECVELLTGAPLHTSPEAETLAARILQHIRQRVREHAEQFGIRLATAQSEDRRVARRFASADLKDWAGRVATIVKTDPITQDILYTPGAAVAPGAALTPIARATIEGRLHTFLDQPAVAILPLNDWDISPEAAAALIQQIFHRTAVKRLILATR